MELSWSAALWVMLGGALGAAGRALLTQRLSTSQPGAHARGTFVANVLASFLIVVFFGLTSGALALFLVAGLCGALSTYSTFSMEVVRLHRSGRTRRAWTYAILTVTATVTAAAFGTVVVGLVR